MTEAAKARRLILAGALVASLGLLLAGTIVPAGLAGRGLGAAFGAVSLIGWGMLGTGLHRFGRARP